MPVSIRDAGPGDLDAILAIYNDAVVNTTAVYTEAPRIPDEQRAWFAQKQSQGLPVLVAVGDDGAVAGFASYGPFRPWPGFRATVENSLYVDPARRGRGIGGHLLAALLERGRQQGYHVMVAGIDGDNATSLHLHVKAGFRETARMPEVGQKFGRWLTLVFLQKNLSGKQAPEA